MNRAHTITTTTIDRWLLPHIAGLIAYANTDATFAVTLATWLDEENWSITPVPNVSNSPYLTPTETEQADDVLDWLMYELGTHPEARIARSLLMTWASDYEIPRDFIVMGLGGTMIPGLTVGDPSIKRKKKSQLQLVVNEDWVAEQSPAAFTAATHRLSQQLVAAELRKAGGKVNSLHPDTAEWCMGAAGTAVYTAPAADLTTLQRAAEADSLSYLSEENAAGLTMLAISPCVHDSLVDELIDCDAS